MYLKPLKNQTFRTPHYLIYPPKSPAQVDPILPPPFSDHIFFVSFHQKPLIMKNLILILSIFLVACNATNTENNTQSEEVALDFYLGSWALDLDYESNNAGWLEISRENNYLDAELLWRWGSVTPVEFVYYADNVVYVKRGRDLKRMKEGMDEPVRLHHVQNTFIIEKVGEDSISGTAIFPDHSGVGAVEISFTGKRLPPPGNPPNLAEVNFGEPIELFNGKDLSGWELLNEGSVNGWKVVDGVLVNDPVQKEGEPHIHYGNLRTTETFEDFNLKLEVNVPEGSNSGIYLRGIYEIQVLDSYGKELDSHNMGALYSRIAPSKPAEKPAGEWQQLDITLVDRYLTVVLNGTKIIDNEFVEGVTGGAITSNEFVPGPIYLQGDHGPVKYRDIVLRPVGGM